MGDCYRLLTFRLEKERYTHLNAEFHQIARRDKKAFLSEQCKKIEENNRMGKTRDLVQKIRDTKGTFHEQKILRRGGKSTQKNYTKKIFMTQIIMNRKRWEYQTT